MSISGSKGRYSVASDVRPSLQFNGKIATISLRNPSVSNRLSPDDLHLLRQHINTVNAINEILVLRFTSTGKYFCSGYDLGCLDDPDAPGTLFFGEVIDAIETARPVTIAAIQGGAYGGGTDLCLACDFRVGTHDANIFMPAARFGLHFYPGGIRRYLSRLGLNSSKRLFLTAERLESEEMLRIGFLTELVSAEDLHQRLDHLSEELAMMAPLALLGIKRDLNAMVRGDFDILKNNDLVLQSERSNDLKEAVTAWREQRKPHFIGK